MNLLIRDIDEMIEERSLLKHPFYQMWSDGELSHESLAGYSQEYFQLVQAIPQFMTPIIEQAPESIVKELVHNRQEESEHIQPWINFADCLGISQQELEQYPGLIKTQQAVSQLKSLMSDYASGSCAMYAFEKEIPKISQVKLEGLARFYGITTGGAIEYFKLHTEADIRHAAVWRDILESVWTDQEEALIQVADESMSAQNLLLDSCYEAYC